MSLVLQSSGGGSVTLNEPTTASNFTVTLPAASGEVMVSGNQPAFSVYPSASQSIANTTSVLVQCDTKTGSSQLFDTAGAFNNTGSTVTLNGISVPAYSFAPPVAGYYLIGAYASLNGAIGLVSPQIQVNTTFVNLTSYASSASYLGGCNQVLTYLNGTSDYVRFYLYQNSGGSLSTLASRPDLYKFFGNLVRAA
jgi:hypothetical protein